MPDPIPTADIADAAEIADVAEPKGETPAGPCAGDGELDRLVAASRAWSRHVEHMHRCYPHANTRVVDREARRLYRDTATGPSLRSRTRG